MTVPINPPNYDKEDLTIYDDGPQFTVHDPWLAQDRGIFYTKEDAELFAQLLRDRAKETP